MNFQIYRTSDELAHHGVEGQKWGRRRYQNEDGSYKPGAEGRYAPDRKKRYPFERVSIDWEAKRKTDEMIRNPFKLKTKDDPITKIMKKNDEIFQPRHASKNRKLEGEMTEKNRQRAELAEKKHQEHQAKRDERASKNSYKKIIGKYALKNIGYTAAGNVADRVISAKTRRADLGAYANLGIQAIGKTANLIRSGKQAYELYDYRKRKKAQHSDFNNYDALYHSDAGVSYGIKFA